MPDGTTPLPPDLARAALDAARRALEADLARHPDWIALGALLAGEAAGTVADRAALEARLNAVPAYRALYDLDRAAGFLSPLPASAPSRPLASSTTDIVDATIIDLEPEQPDVAAVVRDDLTRIRGIDGELARRLSAIGITTFEQIAGWSTDDVRTIAQGLGLGRNFVRQGVADQAAAFLSQRRHADVAKARARTRVADFAGISGWSGSTTPNATPRERPRANFPPPLATAVRQSVLGRIKRGRKHGDIQPLTRMAPELAAPIFIAIDVDLPDVTPSWLPEPIACVPAPDRLETQPGAQLFITAGLKAPAAIVPVTWSKPEPVAAPPVALPPPLPAHELARRRLDAIEAALATLPTSTTLPPAATIPSPAALAHRMAARLAADRQPDEADVTIVTGTRHTDGRAPNAPNPLTPTGHVPAFQAPTAPQIEEAAVSIVKPQRTPVGTIVTTRYAPTPPARRADVLRSFFRLPREREPFRTG